MGRDLRAMAGLQRGGPAQGAAVQARTGLPHFAPLLTQAGAASTVGGSVFMGFCLTVCVKGEVVRKLSVSCPPWEGGADLSRLPL